MFDPAVHFISPPRPSQPGALADVILALGAMLALTVCIALGVGLGLPLAWQIDRSLSPAIEWVE